jgi:hypothetical protein
MRVPQPLQLLAIHAICCPESPVFSPVRFLPICRSGACRVGVAGNQFAHGSEVLPPRGRKGLEN